MSLLPGWTSNKFSRVKTPSSDIRIGAASINSNRTKIYLAPTILFVIELSWRGRCISKTMQPESMISIYEPSISGTENAFEIIWDMESHNMSLTRC
jgi:hypothetical protein